MGKVWLVVERRGQHFKQGFERGEIAIVHGGRLDKGAQLITKPFSYAELAAKVRDVLDQSQPR